MNSVTYITRKDKTYSVPEDKSQIPPIASLKKSLEGLDPLYIRDHLERLDPDYFSTFSPREIRSHIECFLSLDRNKLAFALVNPHPQTGFTVTILGFDFQGLFAVICGLLTLHGFNIQSGKIFTYKKSVKPADSSPTDGDTKKYYLQRKKVVDTFHCLASIPSAEHMAEALTRELQTYLTLVSQQKQSEVHHELTNRIGRFLARISEGERKTLLPVNIAIDVEPDYTVLHTSGPDTPAYLYSLANALNLQGISIHKVIIATENKQVNDTIYITDRYDRPITDPGYLEKLHAAVVLIKQFTMHLSVATDPSSAMHQFDQFLDTLLKEDRLVSEIKSQPEFFLTSLAKIFGASSYVWEEFIRMQHEHLLPFIKNIDAFRKSKTKDTMIAELMSRVTGLKSLDDKISAVNIYKDSELFRIDLVPLLFPRITFIQFSLELTRHAEAILSVAAQIIFRDLTEEFGGPLTEKGQICRFAIFGLGKFGGEELGYASDLELQLIYENAGRTDHANRSTDNAQFFSRLAQKLKESIHAKEKGIFEIDLRLRPHGNKGPLAAAFPQWREYYSPEGQAHDYERQSLIKLRPIYGDADFTDTIIKARDELIYRDPPIPLHNAIDMRSKQLTELSRESRINAKFSKGGLTDLEYSIQYLQLTRGHAYPELRTTNTITAMEFLLEHGILTPTEFEKLYSSYAFLRRLINALRMVRGNARDLELPLFDSEEFTFLAKNLGYVSKGEVPPQKILKDDAASTFETVHLFYLGKFIQKREKIFEESGLPALLFSREASGSEIESFFSSLNVGNPQKAFACFKRLLDAVKDKSTLLTVLVLAERHIRQSPDPEKVILNLENFIIGGQNNEGLLKQMLFQPRYIEMAAIIFGFSEYLSNILVNDPNLLLSIHEERVLFFNKSVDHYALELVSLAPLSKTIDENIEQIRSYKNREILRIGLRDIYLHVDLERIVREISDLADAIVAHVYQNILITKGMEALANHHSIIALGKLGARELNYSSDIDLDFVVSNTADARPDHSSATAVTDSLIQYLTASSVHGKLYRVDTRLRPYGKYGQLVGTVRYYQDYYTGKAEGWELQSWLRGRAVAGNIEMGEKLVRQIQGLFLRHEFQEKIEKNIDHMRKAMAKELLIKDLSHREVKRGPGGIRAVEFFVQHHVLHYAHKHPDLISGNSLYLIEKLNAHGLIDAAAYKLLRNGYQFLRTIEHRIQLLGLEQKHVLPTDDEEITRLAKRMEFEDHLDEPAGSQFLKVYEYYTENIKKLVEGI